MHEVSRRAWGLRLRRAPCVLAFAHAWMLPSPCVHRVGAPNSFFEAQYPAHRCLCLRFACCLTTAYAKLEVGMVRYSFPVRLFHSLLHAGLSRRTDTHCFPLFSQKTDNGCPGSSSRFFPIRFCPRGTKRNFVYFVVKRDNWRRAKGVVGNRNQYAGKP